jgi:hypothetical protein
LLDNFLVERMGPVFKDVLSSDDHILDCGTCEPEDDNG